MGSITTCTKIVSRQKGFSLIELMAASLVLGIAITGVMSMLGTGKAIEFRDKLRREARVIAANALEDSTYHFTNYATMATPLGSPPTVLLEAGTANPISATLNVIVSPEFFEPWNEIALPLPQIPFKRVRAGVSWTVGAEPDSVYITKRVAEVR